MEPVALVFDMGLRSSNGGSVISEMVASAILNITYTGYFELAKHLEAEDLERLADSLEQSFTGRASHQNLYQKEMYKQLLWLDPISEDYWNSFFSFVRARDMEQVRLLRTS